MNNIQVYVILNHLDLNLKLKNTCYGNLVMLKNLKNFKNEH